MRPLCRWCVARLRHPWHDNGTPNMVVLQDIIDSYTNFLDSVGDNDVIR